MKRFIFLSSQSDNWTTFAMWLIFLMCHTCSGCNHRLLRGLEWDVHAREKWVSDFEIYGMYLKKRIQYTTPFILYHCMILGHSHIFDTIEFIFYPLFLWLLTVSSSHIFLLHEEAPLKASNRSIIYCDQTKMSWHSEYFRIRFVQAWHDHWHVIINLSSSE